MTDLTSGRCYDPDDTPPLVQAVPLGMQHVLAMCASKVTPSITVVGAAGLAVGGPEKVYLVQMAMLALFKTVGIGAHRHAPVHHAGHELCFCGRVVDLGLVPVAVQYLPRYGANPRQIRRRRHRTDGHRPQTRAC